MGTRTLGIDISDGHISGVVLEQRRRATVLLNWCSLPIPEGSDRATCILQVCEQLDWDGEICVCGLPLSLLSVRNLTLPFSDVKKITQALPFELEEQLLAPLESLAYDAYLARKNGGDSLLIVFTVDQAWLGTLLGQIAERIDPDRVLPAMVPLAEQCIRFRRNKEPILLVHAEFHAMSIAFVVEGRPVLFRRISHPEQMIVHPPFTFENSRIIAQSPAAEQCMPLLASLIQQSLDFFRMESRIMDQPEEVLLTGPFAALDDSLIAMMSSALGLPVERLRLLEDAEVSCTEEQRTQWDGPRMDRALALALSGKSKSSLNLRKHHLAKKMSLLSARKRLLLPAAALCCLFLIGLGYVGFDTHTLRQRDKALDREMRTIYQTTFPEVTRIQDPYIEMQAKLKSLQGTETALPYFVTERWVLPVLADISRRIPVSLSLKVARLSMDREGLVIKGTTDTFNGVESIKTAVSGSPRLSAVRIVSATVDKGKKDGAVRFELQMQLVGM
ncbi:type II secretion system protein GspL [Desulfobulbus propionicus]|jgi:general secretion pathway protein L